MSVLVWIEQIGGQVVPSSWEILGKGRVLAQALGTNLAALVVGDSVEDLVEETRRHGPDLVYAASDPVLGHYRLEAYAAVWKDAIAAAGATVVLANATVRGRDLSALVACELGAGLAPDAIDLRIEVGRLAAVRSIYSGNLLVDIHFDSDVQFASVRPRSFPMPQAGEATGEVRPLPVPVAEDQIGEKVVEVRLVERGEVSLTEASIVVSGGRGVARDPEWGFQLVGELADVLGAAVGASRAAVDAGYIPYKHQVGQTGSTVKPDLYIAAGISGAIQHLAGMANSRVIVAINTDPHAPIFERASYGIVGDLFQVLPALAGALRSRLGR